MKRWLILTLGLGIGLLAVYGLLTSASPPSAPKSKAAAPTSRAVAEADPGAPLGDIREPSRARLREILREVDRREREEEAPR